MSQTRVEEAVWDFPVAPMMTGGGFPEGGGWESEAGLGLSAGSVPLSLPFRDGELFSRGLLEGYHVWLSVVGKKGCCGIVARESDAAFDSRDRRL
jgi:hypothetical protein